MKIKPLNTICQTDTSIKKNNNSFQKKKIVINKVVTTPYNISFRAEASFDDKYFFNTDNEIDFKINFNKYINHKLNLYKTSAEANDSVYLTDKKEDKIKAKKNITLLGESSANLIKSNLADIHNNSSAKNIKAEELYLFDDAKAEEVDSKNIVISNNANILYAKAKRTWLVDKGNAEQINTDEHYQRNNATVNDVLAQKIYIRDNAKIENAHAPKILLKGNAGINKAFVENGVIKLSDNSFVENLNPENSKVLLSENTKIQTITADSDIDITGNGTIGNIYTNGSSVVLRGPVKLEGKIVFGDKNGSVIVQKAPYNTYPKIKNDNVENGTLEFLMLKNNEIVIGNPGEIFGDGIKIAENTMPEEATERTSVFSDLSYLIKYYKNFNPELSDKIKNVIQSENANIARKLFKEFYTSNLKTLNSRNKEKFFSLTFVENAMIGKENLVDFWLKVIGKNPENNVDKIKILNNLSSQEKSEITNASVKYWLDEVLPEQINSQKHNNISFVQKDIDFTKTLIKKLEKSPQSIVSDLDNKTFYKKLSDTEINQQKITDIWINSKMPKNLGSERLKKEYLKTLIENPDLRQIIIAKTAENTEIAQNFLNNYKSACQDIIDNETDISKTEKEILKNFKNDKNLYNYTFNKTEDKKNIPEIETVILSAITQISKEYETLSIKAQKEIFNRVLKIPEVVKSDKNSQLYNYVNFILTQYGQMTATENPVSAQDNIDQLSTFKKHVENNSLFFENLWRNIVNSSFTFYIKDTLNTVNADNIRMLASVSKKRPQNTSIETLIDGKYIEQIEQKDFISRYQDDPNFVTLMKNDGINKKEVLSDLLMTEAVNDSLYQQRLQQFNKEITPESVVENLDIAEKYFKILDMDSSSMTLNQKVIILSQIPQEELSMLNSVVIKDWRNNELAKFMSDKFVSTQLEHNINAQGKNIGDVLSKMCEYLNSINVNLQGQNYTLYELTKNIDKIAKLSEKSFKELYFMGQNIEAINGNTESMKSNIKAILYSVMQNSKIKDSELTESIKKLLPENEKKPLSEFVSKVNIKCKEIKDEKRKSQLKSLANLVVVAIGATGFEYLGGDMLSKFFGSGETISKVTSALCGVAKTVKHVSILKAATTGMKRD